jgi:hypothetical protein
MDWQAGLNFGECKIFQKRKGAMHSYRQGRYSAVSYGCRHFLKCPLPEKRNFSQFCVPHYPDFTVRIEPAAFGRVDYEVSAAHNRPEGVDIAATVVGIEGTHELSSMIGSDCFSKQLRFGSRIQTYVITCGKRLQHFNLRSRGRVPLGHFLTKTVEPVCIGPAEEPLSDRGGFRERHSDENRAACIASAPAGDPMLTASVDKLNHLFGDAIYHPVNGYRL